MFTHVILTRFNLATPGREATIRNKPDWLADRFDLFERFCLPSIAAQSNRNFSWVVYFDEKTPAEFKTRIQTLRDTFPFIPYFTGLFDRAGWARSIREVATPNAPCLLTTRLDNDDALATDFVARLHAYVADRQYMPGFYNFSEGLIRREGAVYALKHPSNAFSSRLEPTSSVFETVSCISHMDITAHGAVQQIGGDPAWMQIIHSRNVSNRVRGRRVSPEIAESLFVGDATKGLKPVSDVERIAENILIRPIWEGRDRLIGLMRKVAN